MLLLVAYKEEVSMYSNNSIHLNQDDWAAITTSNQFHALGLYANYCLNQEDEWRSYIKYLTQRPIHKINKRNVYDHLVNSWRSETQLLLTLQQFKLSKSGFVVHWAFPQSYYSLLYSTLASFSVTGFREKKNQTVQRKVAHLASVRALPKSMNIWVDGGMQNLKVNGIESSFQNFKSARIIPDDFENIKRHIISIFLSTRKSQLEDKKPDLNIMTKDQTKLKKVLNADDWAHVSKALGKTSWLCILNRKRLQTNYKEVETFNSDYFDTQTILNGLMKFTYTFNLVNEINVAHKIGLIEMQKWVPKHFSYVHSRIKLMHDLYDPFIPQNKAC